MGGRISSIRKVARGKSQVKFDLFVSRRARRRGTWCTGSCGAWLTPGRAWPSSPSLKLTLLRRSECCPSFLAVVAHPAGSAAQELKRISCSYILLLATPHLSLAFRKLEKRRGFFVNRGFLSHCRRSRRGCRGFRGG